VCVGRLARASESDATDDAAARDAHSLAAAEKCAKMMRDDASARAPEIDVAMEEIDEKTHGSRARALPSRRRRGRHGARDGVT
jgi:hypothetical protein